MNAMNRAITVAVIAIFVVFLYTAGTYHTYQVTEEVGRRLQTAEQAALAGEKDKAQEISKELQSFWEEKEKVLMLYIRHNDLDSVAEYLSELESLIALDDIGEFCSKLNQTHRLVDHIWESELPLWKNIL